MVLKKNGFTIVELIIVIAIIAILAAVAVPSYIAISNKAEESVCLDTRNNIIKIEETYAAMNSGTHSAEYINCSNISEESELVTAGYLYTDDLVCPVTDEQLRWMPFDGEEQYIVIHMERNMNL